MQVSVFDKQDIGDEQQIAKKLAVGVVSSRTKKFAPDDIVALLVTYHHFGMNRSIKLTFSNIKEKGSFTYLTV